VQTNSWNVMMLDVLSSKWFKVRKDLYCWRWKLFI